MISIPVDTRPTIIKVSPVIRELQKRNKDFFICNTRQLLSLKPKDKALKLISPIAKRIISTYMFDGVFFEQLNLPEPKYKLDIGSGTQAEQVAKAMIKLEKVFHKEKPDLVLIHGDANMVPSASIAAVKMGIKSIHKEAGLRSYNRKMPEEINRVIADHVCDYLFAPTKYSKNNLLKEGIPEDKIFVTGNTIVDAVNYNIKIAEKMDIQVPEDFVLLTLHRAENVDDISILKNLLNGIEMVSNHIEKTIIWPMHPRVRARLMRNKLMKNVNNIKNIEIIQPLGYFEFLKHLNSSNFVMTDSGGVQEEACTLQVPCVTLRTETERPESVHVGANIITGVDSPQKILDSVKTMINIKRKWENPFGDGRAGEKVVDLMEDLMGDI